MVLFLSVEANIVEKRLVERGKTSGRSDDNMGAIKKRMDTYRRETLPVVNFYREEGTLTSVDAD